MIRLRYRAALKMARSCHGHAAGDRLSGWETGQRKFDWGDSDRFCPLMSKPVDALSAVLATGYGGDRWRWVLSTVDNGKEWDAIPTAQFRSHSAILSPGSLACAS